MKRLFWPLLTIFAALAVWFFARQQMDSLYAEISRLRRYEEKDKEQRAYYAKKHKQTSQAEQERLAKMSSQERLDHEMKMATINSYLRDKLGKAYDELES